MTSGKPTDLQDRFKPTSPPTFKKRDINRNRLHVVFTHELKMVGKKPIRMYYMSHNGDEVGHAGIGMDNRRLYNVMVHPQFREHKLGYRLMAFIMNQPDPPTNLIASSTNPQISNDTLCSFYGQFGFKRVEHPVHHYYMEYAP